MNRKVIGALIGFVMGFFLLHPASMFISGLVHPEATFNFAGLLNAFSPHHLPMAFFFGALGALFGYMNISYTMILSKEKHRVRMLESLLPICAYCKKIRDDSNVGVPGGKWVAVERYISSKTETKFTHGMCPECYQAAMRELDREDESESVKEPARP